MQFNPANAAAETPRPMEPVNVNLTLENEDDVRWFYHLMNMQAPEITKAYSGNRLGSFEDRFRDFNIPEGKKELFRFVKQVASENDIRL